MIFKFVSRKIKTSQRESVFPGEVDTQVRKSKDKDKDRESRFSLAKLRLKFVSRKIKTGHRDSTSAGRGGFTEKTGVNG